jgi:porin
MAFSLALTAAGSASAYDVNDQLAINGLLAGAYQCQQVAGLPETDNVCRGALPFQPELFYNPTKQDQFFVKLGFAAGNGLNQVSPFVLKPWAADLEDDVKHINGRNRSYLLEAWYAHTFKLTEDNSVQLTGGIIDPTFYVNENAYANNEYTQFMNEVFVNARSGYIPTYDIGGVLVWKFRDLTFTGIGMNVGENADGKNFNYYTGEADYHLKTVLGEGNYRVMYAATSRAFLDPTGARLEHREGWELSFDQELGRVVGAFLRCGWQGEDAQVDYQSEYSGGFNFKGAAWGREADNIGVGLAYLAGANENIARTNVFEGYYRFAFNKHLALTGDVQYMKDQYRDQPDVDGWILGMRAVVEF